MAKNIIPDSLEYSATKLLELPGLRGLYKIRHPFKFHYLKKFHLSPGAQNIKAINVDSIVEDRTKSQKVIFELRKKVQYQQDLSGVFRGINDIEKNKEIDKVLKKIATGSSTITDLKRIIC